MKKILVVLISVILAACSYPWQRAVELPTTSVATVPTLTPSPTAESEMCAFMWAYQDLPEISKDVQSTIQKIQPDTRAYAQAFGENCVYADGRATFSAMETDFYITFQVQSIDNVDELGRLIIETMKILDKFPPGKVPGGQDGFAEFRFESGENHAVLRVPIRAYKELPPGTNNTDVFHTFETPTP